MTTVATSNSQSNTHPNCMICADLGKQKQARGWFSTVSSNNKTNVCETCLVDPFTDEGVFDQKAYDETPYICDVKKCKKKMRYTIIHYGIISYSLQREISYRCEDHAGYF